jgi:hypothetical protein
MDDVKKIVLKVIPSGIANDFVHKYHYSGKVVENSQLHFGAFYDNRLHGVLSFGCPLDRRRVLGLVVHRETGQPAAWNDMLELNRMAFDEVLPKNSESRSIAVCIKLIRKQAPNIRWILSFADGSHCGDGTIYRASGFALTGIKETDMIEIPERLRKYNGGSPYAHRMTLQAKSNIMYKIIQKELDLRGGYRTLEWYAEKLGTKIVGGYQLRYIKILDGNYRLAVPELPYSKITEIGAGMYRGEQR